MCGNLVLHASFIVGKVKAGRELGKTFIIGVDSSFEKSQRLDRVSCSVLSGSLFKFNTSYKG